MHQRGDAISSIVYEANARVRDPVYGCVGAITSLHQQIGILQNQLAVTQAELVELRMQQITATSTNHKAESLFTMDMADFGRPSSWSS